MSKKVLLDANLIISAFDSKNAEALEKITLLLNDDSELCITPLIRYEVLRGIAFDDADRYDRLCEILNSFIELDIKRNSSELASCLFRYAKSCKRDIVNKRSFDVLHCTTALCNQCELQSNDGDIAKIEKLHDDYINAIT
jgi:predicted nucleic acid-binding protein